MDTVTAEFMGLLVAKLHGTPAERLENTSGLPIRELLPIPLRYLMAVVEHLGTHNIWSLEGESGSGCTFEAAAAVLENWPEGFHGFLRRYGNRTRAVREDAASLQQQFNPFYRRMFHGYHIVEYTAFIKREFVRFALQHWEHALVPPWMASREDRDRTRFVSKSEFMQRFAVWKPTLERMVQAGSVVCKVLRQGSRNVTVVDIQKSQVPDGSTGTVHVRDAAAYLGLPVSVVQTLKRWGVLVTRERRGGRRSLHQDDVEEFLRRGIEIAERGSTEGDCVALRDAMRCKLGSQSGKADIVAAVYDGRLQVLGRTGNCLGGLLLDRCQLETFIAEKRKELNGDTYSFPEAAAKTGLISSVIANAVQLGLLQAAEHSGGVQRIPESSIEVFNRTYVPLKEAAKELKTSSEALRRLCAANGIPIVDLTRPDHASPLPIVPRSKRSVLIDLWRAKSPSRRPPKIDQALAYQQVLRTYLETLKESGADLPRRGLSINKSAVAKACGFRRYAFHRYPALNELLMQYENARSDGPINALRTYLADLEAKGMRLPKGRRDKPNLLAIARACGICRDLFYRSADAMALVEEFWSIKSALPDLTVAAKQSSRRAA